MFRNETQKVERQVTKDVATPSNDVILDSHSSRELVRQHGTPSSSNTSLSLISMADATWQDRAICFFFDQFIIPPNQDNEMRHLDYLPTLYSQLGQGKSVQSSSCLSWAVEATALMTFGNVVRAPQLITKARQGYGKALRTLREALSSPTEALRDETFASVVVLSLFEDVTGERNGLFSSHTAGFEFLVKLRGEGQLKTHQGRDLFNFAYTHTVRPFPSLAIFIEDLD